MSRIIISCALLLVCAGARADDDAGCIKTLSPPALEIYRAALPAIRPDLDLAFVLRAKVGPMVMSGHMSASTARVAARAASVCLHGVQTRQEFAARSGPPS